MNLKKKYYKAIAMRSEYKIELAPNAQRQLKKLSKQLQLTIKSLGILLYAGFPPTQQCRHGVTLKTFVDPRNKVIYFLPNKRSISLSLSSI
ncbi:hypothetical protein [Rickettsia bellii]|uniref:hypothetical protein n=1 Tax=Rickettsia bellii TaxID=33990 RepID=UPI0005A010CA|nr:hypothetical protein [Rickettsia bellii]